MSSFWKPKSFTNSDGDERKVGFEMEFGNLPVKETAEALHELLGGSLEKKNPYVYTLEDSELGRIKIERDAQLLSSTKYRGALDKLKLDYSPGSSAHELEEMVDKLSSYIVPCEIVTAPLPFEQFERLSEVRKLLQELGAEGTEASLMNAFGLHLNPEVPDLEPATQLRYLQAFLLLYDWIVETSDIDITRRFFTNYIDPFPDEYADLVLDPDYVPDSDGLIDDYLRCNATRNRALDLLPVLCEIDADRVKAGLEEDERALLGARPAYHYRLPDFRLDDSDWSIAGAWNYWWVVETLATDDELRLDLIAGWRKQERGLLSFFRKDWSKKVAETLKERIPNLDR